MKLEEKFSPPAKGQGAGLVVVRFETPQAYLNALAAERSVVEEFRKKASSQINNDYSISPVLQEVFNRIRQREETFQNQLNNGASADRLRATIAEDSQRMLPATSAQVKYMREIADADPLFTLRVLLCWYRVPANYSQTNWVIDWFRASALTEFLSRGWVKNIDGLDTTLSNLAASWDGRFQSLDEKHTQIVDQLSKTDAQLSELLAASTDQVGALIAQHKLDIEGAIKEGSNQIEAVRETYKTELTLQAPTTYWRDKQVAHRWISAAWMVAFVAISGIATAAVWRVWAVTVEPILGAKITPSYGYFLPTLGAVFLSVWILRILSRQILANLSLSSDAGERVAMVKTFLALMQKPDHVREPDRVLILSALFRPTTNPSEDGAPPSWFDLVMQRLGPQK